MSLQNEHASLLAQNADIYASDDSSELNCACRNQLKRLKNEMSHTSDDGAIGASLRGRLVCNFCTYAIHQNETYYRCRGGCAATVCSGCFAQHRHRRGKAVKECLPAGSNANRVVEQLGVYKSNAKCCPTGLKWPSTNASHCFYCTLLQTHKLVETGFPDDGSAPKFTCCDRDMCAWICILCMADTFTGWNLSAWFLASLRAEVENKYAINKNRGLVRVVAEILCCRFCVLQQVVDELIANKDHPGLVVACTTCGDPPRSVVPSPRPHQRMQ